MKSNIQAILRHCHDFEWSLQGFGMLRTYIDSRVRLHVWAPSLAYPGVSTIHDHPWDFESRIIVGSIRNVIYEPCSDGPPYMKQRVICGPGGGMIDIPPEPIRLWPASDIMYREGETYKMEAPWLHEPIPVEGTVSLIVRDFRENTEEATVCYPQGSKWGSAEPRPATREEVECGVRTALEKF